MRMGVVTWSSWLKIIVPDGDVTLAVLTVNVPARLARQEPEANVIVLRGMVLAPVLKSTVAPFWAVIEELPIELVLNTKSRPLFTVIPPITLLPDARFRIRSFPPVVSPVPPLIVPVK